MRPVPNEGILEILPYVGGKSSAAAGVRVVKLSSNETPLGASPSAQEAYMQAVSSLHRYPDGSARKLREAIAEIHKLPVEQIVCGAGSDELIGLLVHGYVGAGDEVVISQYGFLMYAIYAKSVGAKVVYAPEKNLTTDVDALLAAVTEKTKIVFVANPNNPTGTYISASEMLRLRNGLPEHVILAIDGAYSEYAAAPDFSDGRELVYSTENTVMLRTFSKIYGLSSLRLGWMFSPVAITDVVNRIRGPFNVSTPAIMAGEAAIRDTEFTANAVDFNNKWRAFMEKELSALGLKVTSGLCNFVLVEFPEQIHTAAAASSFLMQRGLIVREVVNYGLPNHLRITIGLEDDNKALISALADFLKT